MAVRAKFRCNSVEQFDTTGSGMRSFRFSAVYDDGVPENERYAKYTPSGELRIAVDNPNVTFEPGKSYYLDFSSVEE